MLETLTLTVERKHWDRAEKAREKGASLPRSCPIAQAARDAFGVTCFVSQLFLHLKEGVNKEAKTTPASSWLAQEGPSRTLHNAIVRAFDLEDRGALEGLLKKPLQIVYVQPSKA